MAEIVNKSEVTKLMKYQEDMKNDREELRLIKEDIFGAIVRTNSGNYWKQEYSYWSKLDSFQIWWYKLIGKIK